MPDWSIVAATVAAELRHASALRHHTGYPRSDGRTLYVACQCGTRCTPPGWHSHLMRILAAANRKEI